MAQVFPRWTNETPRLITLGTLAATAFGIFAVYWWASPYNTDVGYQPKQPIPYSHKLHVGQLGMDCRYCHAYVERGAFAGVPPTQVCMNCHRQVKKDSALLEPLRKSWADGNGTESIPWKRIHKIPDFAYFNHSAHVGVGVGANRAAIGCETCHGRIDTMEVVHQVQPLSMSWCIECHSNPAPNLRPVEKVTAMGFSGDQTWRDHAQVIAEGLHPPGNLNAAQRMKPDGTYATYATAGCSGCHR
jgi:hypothetical protein